MLRRLSLIIQHGIGQTCPTVELRIFFGSTTPPPPPKKGKNRTDRPTPPEPEMRSEELLTKSSDWIPPKLRNFHFQFSFFLSTDLREICNPLLKNKFGLRYYLNAFVMAVLN